MQSPVVHPFRILDRRAIVVIAAIAACSEPTTEAPTPLAASAAATKESESMPAPPETPLPPAAIALRAPLDAHVAEILPTIAAIPAQRREVLDRVAEFVASKRAAGEPASLLFICTHNSRRSHLAQVWAATAAAYFGVEGVQTYSGGTEATAFNPRAVAALERAGFAVEAPSIGDNPRYRVRFADDGPGLEAWSKAYDDPENPHEGFAAIMTCSAADAACPTVKGAKLRVGLPYEDPKQADDTPQESGRYDERSRQIASEMFYLLARAGA